MKYDVNNWGFNFEGLWRWPVINIVMLIHGKSYLVSLEIVVDFKKLRSFQLLVEKPDITYCRTFNTKSPEPSCRISPKT